MNPICLLSQEKHQWWWKLQKRGENEQITNGFARNNHNEDKALMDYRWTTDFLEAKLMFWHANFNTVSNMKLVYFTT